MSNPKNGELYIFDDTDRVNGQGHTSIGGKISKSKYEYVASEGRIDSDGNPITGGASEVTHRTFNDFETLMSEIIRPQGYDKMLTIKNLTYNQVRTAMGVALTQAESYYQFAISNCFTVVAEAMRSIGLYDGGFGTFIPNNGFYNIYYHYNPRKWYE